MGDQVNTRKRLTRDQLVTIEDLEQFKIELTEIIKKLLKGNGTLHSRPWLKTNEVKALLGISTGKLVTLRANGTLPYTRIGGIVYYKAEDIHNMFEKEQPKGK